MRFNKNSVHLYDLPDDIDFGNSVAVDTEAMGLINKRDRLCVVQMRTEKGDVHIVHFPEPEKYSESKNLCAMLTNPDIQKIYHFARFDIAIIKQYLGVWNKNYFCTKIASKIARTYTDSHSLRELCCEILNVQLNKKQQSSDWGSATLTPQQLEYAANDVIYLHKIRDRLIYMMQREGRIKFLQPSLDFLQTRIELDMAGWDNVDIHSFL